MTADRFEHQIRSARSTITALQRHSREAREPPMSLPDLEALHTALEELQVAEEEMRQQNEALLATRHALEMERQRYAELFEFAPNGYVVTDAAGGIREANRVFATLLQVAAKFLVGKPLVSFIAEERRSAFRSELNRLRTDERVGEWETRLQPRDSAPLDVAVSVAVVRDAKGETAALRWMVRDITERNRTQAQIERLNADLEQRVSDRTAELQTANELKNGLLIRERQARADAESAHNWLSYLAEASMTLASSLEVEATLQYAARLTVPRLADHCCVDVVEEEAGAGQTSRRRVVAHAETFDEKLSGQFRNLGVDDHDWPPGLAEVLRTGEPVLVPDLASVGRQFPDCDAEGARLLEEMGVHSYLIVPLVTSGRTLGAMVLLSASDQRRYGPLEQSLAEDLARRAALSVDNALLYHKLQTANRSKDHFLAMLAHELRNPLSPILNALHLLRLRAPDAQVIERVRDVVERQVQHMARLIDDLLNVTRIARGKISLRREQLDLVDLVRASAEDRRGAIEVAGLALLLELPAEPVWIVGDATRLAQVVGNLLQNATQFTEAGGEITVRVAPIWEDHVVAITVRDTGIGMEQELVRNVFEMFTQADVSLERSQGGLGLGLALVKGLVELHGGEVRAYSAGLGRGAEFTVFLPLPESHRPTLELNLPVAAPSQQAACATRVLVIEDNRDAAETLQELLEAWEYEVAVAYTGTAALEMARELQPAIVVCDLGLPGMDGYAVAAALREDPATASAHLIALTGYGDDEDRRRAREAGFDVHLTKPLDPPALQRLLAGIGSEE
jgi:PAS domain S-box-containing protein